MKRRESRSRRGAARWLLPPRGAATCHEFFTTGQGRRHRPGCRKGDRQARPGGRHPSLSRPETGRGRWAGASPLTTGRATGISRGIIEASPKEPGKERLLEGPGGASRRGFSLRSQCRRRGPGTAPAKTSGRRLPRHRVSGILYSSSGGPFVALFPRPTSSNPPRLGREPSGARGATGRFTVAGGGALLGRRGVEPTVPRSRGGRTNEPATGRGHAARPVCIECRSRARRPRSCSFCKQWLECARSCGYHGTTIGRFAGHPLSEGDSSRDTNSPCPRWAGEPVVRVMAGALRSGFTISPRSCHGRTFRERAPGRG